MLATVLFGMSTEEIYARTAGTVLVVNAIITGVNTILARRNKAVLERMELRSKLDHLQTTKAIEKVQEKVEDGSNGKE